MNVFSLSVLGPPEVRYMGQMLKFRTRKELALLIYLSVEGGMHSREKLLTLLWPESDTSHGRMLLRRTLALLRQALGVVEPSALLVERDLLGIAPSAVTVDLHLLNTVFSSVRIPLLLEKLQDKDRQQLLFHLQEALACLRGPFLEGFSLPDTDAFDTWISMQRVTLKHRLDLIFDRLSALQAEGGQTMDAIETVCRWLTFEPLHEVAVQRLMVFYIAVGYREAALQAYKTFSARLVQELQVQPTSEIQALADQIRRADYPHFVPAIRPVSQDELAWLESPLIGRSQEYALLVEAYYAICQGQFRFVLVEGEAGIGKTRLVSDFLNWISGQNVDILRGQAFEVGGKLPYQPLVDVLRARLERENAPEDLLTDTWLAELSRLLPELRDRYSDLPQVITDTMTAPARLHEAVVRLGQALSRRAPLVLWLDDVQWADASSLDLLRTLGLRFRESGCAALLLVCVRSEALITTPALATWVASMEQHTLSVTRLVLDPLSYDNTMQLIQTVLLRPVQRKQTRSSETMTSSLQLASSAEERISHWLFNETQGQPLYIFETLKALLQQRVLILMRDVDGQQIVDVEATAERILELKDFLPPGVRNVIRARLARLTHPAMSLLTAGAVLGHGFSFELLRQVAGIREDEALQALDEVMLHNLLQERVGGPTTGSIYFISHDKVRDVIYTEAGSARRRILHRRAFTLFQQAADSSLVAPAILAYHAFAAGLIIEAFYYLVAAGDEAMHLFAVRDALVVYEQARQAMKERIEPAQRNEVLERQEFQHLYKQLGRAYELLNDVMQARLIYQELLACAREIQKPEIEVLALNSLATLSAQDSTQRDEARRLLQVAQKRAQESGDQVGLARTEWNLAQVSYYAFDMQTALSHGAEALRLAEILQIPELQAQCLNTLAHSKRSLVLWPEAIQDAEQARHLYARAGNRAMEADCLGVLADLQISDGLLLRGIETARAAYSISCQIDNPWGIVSNAIHLTRGLLEIGAYEEALELGRQSLILARTLPFQLLLLLTLMTVGAIHRALFQIAHARLAHQEALEINNTLPAQRYTAYCFAELCADEAVAGKWEEAHNYAKQALASREPRVLIWVASPRWLETEAMVRAGDIKVAQDDVRQFGALFEGRRRCRLAFLRARVVLEQADGNIEQAWLLLQEAAQLSEEIGLVGEQWRVLATLGEIYEQMKKLEQAREVYARAAVIVLALINRIKDESVRQDFLAVPQVKRLLEHITQEFSE